MNKDKVINSWFADMYDQFVTETDDLEFMLSIIGEAPKDVLEVCCGSGRLLVPLAKAGYNATGFDIDEDMLSKIPSKSIGLDNIRFYKGDAVTSDWGGNFDLVVLAGNILINIESDMDYKEAQRLFIKKAAQSLKIGGCLYLDFDLRAKPELVFGDSEERTILEGTDNNGVVGRYMIVGGSYDNAAQIARFVRKTELVTKDGRRILDERESLKHIPSLADVHCWLEDAGFKVKAEYGGNNGKPICEDTCRAIIYAERIGCRLTCI